MGLPQHCSRKYLLSSPGNSYSAQLKYLLLCGAVVVHSDNGWYEFFYRLLEHQKHYIKIAPLTSSNDVYALTDLIKQLQEDKGHTRQIADAGQHFAREVLAHPNIMEYWRRLLREYAQLQTHEVILHPDAVPLGFSVSHPRYMNLEDRHGCHA